MHVDDYIKQDKFKIIKVSYMDVEVYFLNRLDAFNAVDELVKIYGSEAKYESIEVEGDLVKYLKDNGIMEDSQ